jgi:hypothetical protein
MKANQVMLYRQYHGVKANQVLPSHAVQARLVIGADHGRVPHDSQPCGNNDTTHCWE